MTISDFPNYQVSNWGNVKSTLRGKLLKPNLSRAYSQVCLYKDKKAYSKPIHHLVANAFLLNSENKPEIDHIDRNKLNNRVENLRWVTLSENRINRILRPSNTGEKHIHKTRRGYFQIAFNRDGITYSCMEKTIDLAIAKRDKMLLDINEIHQPDSSQ